MNGLIRGGIIGAIVAVILNVIVYLATSSLGLTLNVTNEDIGIVTLAPIIIFTLLGAIGAVVVLWLLDRFTASPIDIFLWIALILGIVSLVPVFLQTETRGAFIGLGLTHVAAALGIVWGILYGLRGDESAR